MSCSSLRASWDPHPTRITQEMPGFGLRAQPGLWRRDRTPDSWGSFWMFPVTPPEPFFLSPPALGLGGRPAFFMHSSAGAGGPGARLEVGVLNLPASSLLAWVLEVVVLLHLQPQLLSAWGQLSPSAPSGWAWSLPPVVAGPGVLASPKWVHGTVLFSPSLICPFVKPPSVTPSSVSS